MTTFLARAASARVSLSVCALACAALLAACGGGGAPERDTRTLTNLPPPQAQACSPNNPYKADAVTWTGNTSAPATTTVGSMELEKARVHQLMADNYLWYGEIQQAVNPYLPLFSDESSADQYFASMFWFHQALRTPAQMKDMVTMAQRTKDRVAALSAASTGVGVLWGVNRLGSGGPLSLAQVLTVEQGSNAAAAGFKRGDKLVSVDGKLVSDVTQSKAIEDAIFRPVLGTSYSYVLEDQTTKAQRTVAVVAAAQVRTPVPMTTTVDVAGRRYGYLVVDTFGPGAEDALIAAVNNLKAAGIQDLVLDLRYNNGDNTEVASRLASMLVDPAFTSGKTFEKVAYNDKRTALNVTTPFMATSATGAPLPNLGLRRLSVLTTPMTAYSSESILNALSAFVDTTTPANGLDIRRIGSFTAGTAYRVGAYDNCGITYLIADAQRLNSKDANNYATGFAPTCGVADDLLHVRGDIKESLLSTAIYNLSNTDTTKPCALLPQ